MRMDCVGCGEAIDLIALLGGHEKWREGVVGSVTDAQAKGARAGLKLGLVLVGAFLLLVAIAVVATVAPGA
jgi:hypothetical protein